MRMRTPTAPDGVWYEIRPVLYQYAGRTYELLRVESYPGRYWHGDHATPEKALAAIPWDALPFGRDAMFTVGDVIELDSRRAGRERGLGRIAV